jgi:hypothetical protein
MCTQDHNALRENPVERRLNSTFIGVQELTGDPIALFNCHHCPGTVAVALPDEWSGVKTKRCRTPGCKGLACHKHSEGVLRELCFNCGLYRVDEVG